MQKSVQCHNLTLLYTYLTQPAYKRRHDFKGTGKPACVAGSLKKTRLEHLAALTYAMR